MGLAQYVPRLGQIVLPQSGFQMLVHVKSEFLFWPDFIPSDPRMSCDKYLLSSTDTIIPHPGRTQGHRSCRQVQWSGGLLQEGQQRAGELKT